MRQVNIHEAKTHFSRLVDDVIHGETIVIAKAGLPVARLAPLEPSGDRERNLIGFLSGRIRVPADFDRMSEADIVADFEGE
ncbi:MAG: hypothetical protein RI885_1905 [Actinomycetota bacterium]